MRKPGDIARDLLTWQDELVVAELEAKRAGERVQEARIRCAELREEVRSLVVAEPAEVAP